MRDLTRLAAAQPAPAPGSRPELGHFEPFPHQVPPDGWRDGEIWCDAAGRDAGKTYGAAWYTAQHMWEAPPCMKGSRPHKGAIIAETFDEARVGMVLPPSGILHHAPFAETPGGENFKQIRFPNGAVIYLISAETEKDIGVLRGKASNLCWLWIDELAKLRHMDLIVEDMTRAVRVGAARIIITSTDRRRRKGWREFKRRDDVHVTAGHSTENTSRSETEGGRRFQERMLAGAATARGRQELGMADDGETDGSALAQVAINDHRLPWPPHRQVEPGRTVCVVDPADGGDDATAVATVLTLPDCWCRHQPDDETHYGVEHVAELAGKIAEWAPRAAVIVRRADPDVAYVETNGVGLRALKALMTLDPDLPWEGIGAAGTKWQRAEPVMPMFEMGTAHVIGTGRCDTFEAEVTDWVPPELAALYPEAEESTWSPNTTDAVVHAIRHEAGIVDLPDDGWAL